MRQHRVGLIMLCMAVVALHLWFASWVGDQVPRHATADQGIQRLSAVYEAELRFSAPPQAVRSPPPPVKRPAVPRPSPPVPQAPASAASSPEPPPEPTSEPMLEPVLEPTPEPPPEPLTMDEPPSAAAPSASEEAVAEVMSSPSEPEAPTTASQPLLSGSDKRHVASGDDESFQWPLATRVSYSLEGHYRGPVHGQATVEWLSLGPYYQVHVDAIVGPSFAPIGSWRLSSEGQITADGLVPRRHENLDRVVIRGTRTRTSEFGDDTVRLNDGTELKRPPGMQDPASLLIQIAYIFITQPERARPGQALDMTVVTTRKVESLRFDVVARETLDTPVGRIETLHVKPQRQVEEKGSAPADMWFAPSLQYLPVKILVKAADQPTFMQLTLAKLPEQQAAPQAP
ncbi:DUF3108 domain-containing protein [Aquabacterium sp. A3]|uniref:DUF3108 domain-containing protein n=1 Tax=Aquabacterium sp. A3 TaxID=3132829 RepID=UPI0031194FE6